MQPHTAGEYLAQLMALLPPGEGLPQDVESNLGRLLAALAAELARVEWLAEFILLELDPRLTVFFVPDWERLLALPDCGTLQTTHAGRQADIVRKYTKPRTLTSQQLIDSAAALGIHITITEHFPYTVDPPPLTEAHMFDVAVDDLEIIYFRAGQSHAGESLATFGDEALICVLEHQKPVHMNYRLVSP